MCDYMVCTMYMTRDKVMRGMLNVMAGARPKSTKYREAMHANGIRVRVKKYDTRVTRPDFSSHPSVFPRYHDYQYYTINGKIV